MWKFTSGSAGSPWLSSLNDHCGREIWEFDSRSNSPEDSQAVEELRAKFTSENKFKKHSSDEMMRYFLKKKNPVPPMPDISSIQPDQAVMPCHVKNALTCAIRFYSCIQCEDGHWAGDYGGPLFLMPGLLICLYITKTIDRVLTQEHKKEMIRYLYNHQNDDGGWGLHIEGHSTMFGSVLNYVSLRILGEPAEGPNVTKGRKWIIGHGSATHITSWGKFWLSVLGVYEWRGNNPLPPEMWLLPYWIPMHPGRMWCHCRQVYLPMSYLYGRRCSGEFTELVASLREEIYDMPYESIPWNKTRNMCAKEDLYYPHPWLQDALWWVLHRVAEPLLLRWPGRYLRRLAMRTAMENVHYEDVNTRYIDIGPVNKVLNMVCCYFEDPHSDAFQKHLPRVHDYLWLAEDGLKMKGYNGSQLWDTAFAVQALAVAAESCEDLMLEAQGALGKAHAFIKSTQVREDCLEMEQFYRHISKGAWPFSTRDHGWPISDCSSEGLKAALILARLPGRLVGEGLPASRLFEAVNVLLSYQNKDGGMATYENTRSYPWLELLNPAETFGDIVIDYSYVECTSACITALSSFAKDFPFHRTQEVEMAIQRARNYIIGIQRDDGSWYGSWGVCFTYGTWFGISGLLASGSTYDSCQHLKKACHFLLSKQLKNGGWGESYLSCQDKVYTNLPGDKAHLVNTAWALISLIESGQYARDPSPLHAAARCLLNGQLPDGDFPQESIMGVFNRNCMISYSAYRNIFPIWALGLYKKVCAL